MITAHIVNIGQAVGPLFPGACVYTMLNNRSASKFDLYLPGRLVASLHYSIDENEMLFIYCEAIEMAEAERHCRELMRRALDESLNRRLKTTITCPIALEHLRTNAQVPKQHDPSAPQRG